MDPIAVLRFMVAAGPRALQTGGAPDSANHTEAVFEVGYDLKGDADSLVWRPVEPVEVPRHALEEIGDVSFAPRMPDTGELKALVYVPGGRLVLSVEAVDEGTLTASEVSFSRH